MDLSTPTISRSLFAFSIFYGGMVCIAGVLGNKQLALGPVSDLGEALGIGPLAIEAGIFGFILLVVVSSSVAELHGGRAANTLVRFGFVPLVFSTLLSLVVVELPPSPDMESDRLAAFELMMGSTPRIWIAGIVSYGISQTLNVTVFSWLKGHEGTRLLWLRTAIAGVASQAVDTLLFVNIAFLGVFPVGELLLGQLVVKILLALFVLPPLVYGFVLLGRRLDGSATSSGQVADAGGSSK